MSPNARTADIPRPGNPNREIFNSAAYDKLCPIFLGPALTRTVSILDPILMRTNMEKKMCLSQRSDLFRVGEKNKSTKTAPNVCLSARHRRRGISRYVPAAVTTQRGKKTSRMVDLFSSAALTLLFCCWAVLPLIAACGTNASHDVNSVAEGAGAYECNLTFPRELFAEGAAQPDIQGIDCSSTGIDSLTFTFYDESGGKLTDENYPCNEHSMMLEIPAGANIRLEVYALSRDGDILLSGVEMGIFIKADQITAGGDILMTPHMEDFDPENTYENRFGMTFNRIPSGSFIMGSPVEEDGRDDDEAQHWVTLTKGFYMQTTEVTQAQWYAVMEDNPSQFSACGENCPVDSVSYYGVQAFIAALNTMEIGTYRLPTEAEWEYSARAGSITSLSNGDYTMENNEHMCVLEPILDSVGWYCGNSGVTYQGCINDSEEGGPECSGSHPVKEKDPNLWGLHDMHGNVWEWCQDWYLKYYPTGPVKDPQGPETGSQRVIRGGSFLNPGLGIRSAHRHMAESYEELNGVGFRLVYIPEG